MAEVRQAGPGHARIDAGAARALREGGTSLLPVGIVEVHGRFDAGDAVEVREAGDGLIGKGICNYSAVELRRVMGLKSAEVRECCRARPRRRSTGTTSCWPRPADFSHGQAPASVTGDLPRRERASRALATHGHRGKDAALLRSPTR